MLGLRQKLSLGFGGLLLIILIIGIQSILQFRDLGHAINVILRENYRSVVACQEMQDALERMDRGILFTFLGYSEEGKEIILKNEARFEKALQIELSNLTIPGEEEKAKVLQAIFLSYKTTLHHLLQPLPEPEARRLYFKENLPLFQQVKSTAGDILEMNQKNMNDANDRARKQAGLAQRQMYIFLFFGVLVASGFMLFVGKWILRPIDRLIRSTEEIRDGNLDLVVQKDSDDEIGRLSEAFNEMTAGLRQFRRTDHAKLIRTERATEEALNRLPDAVAIVDLDGKVEISTDSARNLFDLRTGANIEDLPLDLLKDLFNDILQEGSVVSPAKKRRLLQKFINLEEHYFQPDAAPITDRAGRLTGIILIMKDVTEQRRLEEMKSGLVSTVSHQLKTPLTSIRMAIHLLLEEKVGPLNEKQTDLLLAARDDSDLLHRIVVNLLDISRIESGHLPMSFRQVAPQTLVLEALEPFRRAAQDRGIELETDLPDDLPAVSADPAQIGHVFSNLLTNALRYTAPGGRIRVSAAAEDTLVRFYVSDTGSGIPHQFLQRIFEQFFRAPDQQTETGVGLGLAIAKEIVEAHSGNINVESQEGKGTTFSFTLRRADRPAEERI